MYFHKNSEQNFQLGQNGFLMQANSCQSQEPLFKQCLSIKSYERQLFLYAVATVDHTIRDSFCGVVEQRFSFSNSQLYFINLIISVLLIQQYSTPFSYISLAITFFLTFVVSMYILSLNAWFSHGYYAVNELGPEAKTLDF